MPNVSDTDVNLVILKVYEKQNYFNDTNADVNKGDFIFFNYSSTVDFHPLDIHEKQFFGVADKNIEIGKTGKVNVKFKAKWQPVTGLVPPGTYLYLNYYSGTETFKVEIYRTSSYAANDNFSVIGKTITGTGNPSIGLCFVLINGIVDYIAEVQPSLLFEQNGVYFIEGVQFLDFLSPLVMTKSVWKSRYSILHLGIVKAAGAEINTGTDDTKYVTSKSIKDSDIAFLSDIPTFVNWTSFTVTITLAGAGTVPEYTTKTGYYSRNGNTITIDILCTGVTDPAGAGSTQMRIDLPITASANQLTGATYAGWGINGTTDKPISVQIQPSATYLEMFIGGTTLLTFTGADQNSPSVRNFRIKTEYRG